MNEDLIKQEVYRFYKFNNVNNNLKIQVIFTDEIYQKCLEVTSDDKWRSLLTENHNKLSDFNGTVIPGKKISDIMYIVISNKVFLYDKYTWKGTVHHELTHAYDIYDFALHLGVTNMADILINPYYNCFMYWSEFHARRIGFYNVWCTFFDETNYEEGKENTQSTYTQHTTYLKQFIGTRKFLYEFLQYCGRLSILNSLYDDIQYDFPKIIENEEQQLFLEELNIFLNSNREFGKISKCIDQLNSYVQTFDYYFGI